LYSLTTGRKGKMAKEDEDNWSTIDLNSNSTPEKVEFEIEGEGEGGAENAAAAPEPEEKVVEPAKEAVETEKFETVEPEKENQPEELKGIETNGAQKRIRQLIRQRKEREEEISRLRKEVEDLRGSVSYRDKELYTSIKTGFESTEGQLTSRLNNAKIAYKQAAEHGDTDAMLAAQEEISTVNAEKIALREKKTNFDNYAQQYEESKKKEAVETNKVQNKTPQYDPKAIEWASKNTWFGSDQPLTMAALQIDAALKEEGFDPSDDEYYEEIDTRLRVQFPSKFSKPEPKEQAPRLQDSPKNSAQVVSGASRTPKTSSSGTKKVKLSQEDIRLAQKWGISLEQYAAEKLKVEQSDGDYTTVS